MLRLTSFLMFTILLVGTGAPARAQDAPTTIAGATTVQAQQIIDLIAKEPGLVLLDNRKPEDFAAGHIEGAVRLIDTDITADALAKHAKTKDTPIVFYCNGLKCGRAAKATVMAIEHGYQRVFYYALGMDEWNKLGLPVVKQTASN